MWATGGFGALLVFAVLQGIAAQRWSQPVDVGSGSPASPFFFFCRPADNSLTDHHKIKVEISGNPTAYTPSTVYKSKEVQEKHHRVNTTDLSCCFQYSQSIFRLHLLSIQFPFGPMKNLILSWLRASIQFPIRPPLRRQSENW
jgi:hypothetical protein